MVIDPWMGICVAARHFPEVWCMTLDTMDAVDYEFSSAFCDVEYEPALAYKWMRTNSAYWKRMLCTNQKFLATKKPSHRLIRLWNSSEGKPESDKFAKVNST